MSATLRSHHGLFCGWNIFCAHYWIPINSSADQLKQPFRSSFQARFNTLKWNTPQKGLYQQAIRRVERCFGQKSFQTRNENPKWSLNVYQPLYLDPYVYIYIYIHIFYIYIYIKYLHIYLHIVFRMTFSDPWGSNWTVHTFVVEQKNHKAKIQLSTSISSPQPPIGCVFSVFSSVSSETGFGYLKPKAAAVQRSEALLREMAARWFFNPGGLEVHLYSRDH